MVDETRNLLNDLLNDVDQLNIIGGWIWLEVEGWIGKWQSFNLMVDEA